MLLFIGTIPLGSFAQKNETVWFDGLARSYFARDVIGETLEQDTLSAKNASNGYNLIDLNTHINPIENIEIFAQLRIKNQFGSFFGSGTSIDVRQLTAKGTIKNKVRFSIGDIYLKQNRFTLFNYNEDLSSYENNMFKSYRDIIHYENFYTQNRWRLQGLQTDFSFEFDRFIRTLEVDFFITRPRGSTALSNTTYSSDLLLSGGTILSKLNKKLTLEGNYINLFELPSSGTTNISVNNPVYHSALTYLGNSKNANFKHTLQSGFSERNWLHSELPNGASDSTSNSTEGLFFEFENEYFKNDSTLKITLGYRYVDPNFRSAGAQSRRLNFLPENTNTIYPMYTNSSLTRPRSIFDLLTDETLYNQDISSNLMVFNPIYSNVLPYGDATPNRNGIYLKSQLSTKRKTLVSIINSGFFREVIGQGTAYRRNFILLKGAVKFNIHKIFSWEKQMSLSVSSENEITNRLGDSIESLNLNSHQINVFLSTEIARKLFLQFAFKQFYANGKEFLTQRDNYGNITNFVLTNFDQKDQLISAGISYMLRENVYANIQYNWWGMSFNDQAYPNYNYRRLLFILSVKL